MLSSTCYPVARRERSDGSVRRAICWWRNAPCTSTRSDSYTGGDTFSVSVHVLWFTFMSCLPIISTVSCFTVFLEVVCIPACTYVMSIIISIGPLHMTFTLKPSMYYWYCCPVRYTVAILLPVWWWRKWWVFPSELIKRDTCEFIIIILTCLHVLYAIIYGPRDCIKYFQQSSTVHLLYCGVHYYSQTHVLCGSTDSNEPHCVPTTSPSWPPAVTPNWTSCLYNMSV